METSTNEQQEQRQRHRSAANAWSVGDTRLDWYGAEQPEQGNVAGRQAAGSPTVWTTDDPNNAAFDPLNKLVLRWTWDVFLDTGKRGVAHNRIWPWPDLWQSMQMNFSTDLSTPVVITSLYHYKQLRSVVLRTCTLKPSRRPICFTCSRFPRQAPFHLSAAHLSILTAASIVRIDFRFQISLIYFTNLLPASPLNIRCFCSLLISVTLYDVIRRVHCRSIFMSMHALSARSWQWKKLRRRITTERNLAQRWQLIIR